MSFAPCPSCQRHVSGADAACPFCGARTSVVSRIGSSYAARLTRAAVFAGAAACGGAANQTTPPRPAPVEYPFTLPPAPAQGRASLSGVVREDGHRRASVDVVLHADTGEEKRVRTNDRGEFQFLDLPPGNYSLVSDPGYTYSGRQGGPVMQPQEGVQLLPDANERRDLSIVAPPPYVPDTGPCCKPYGAPPARRRVV